MTAAKDSSKDLILKILTNDAKTFAIMEIPTTAGNMMQQSYDTSTLYGELGVLNYKLLLAFRRLAVARKCAILSWINAVGKHPNSDEGKLMTSGSTSLAEARADAKIEIDKALICLIKLHQGFNSKSNSAEAQSLVFDLVADTERVPFQMLLHAYNNKDWDQLLVQYRGLEQKLFE